MIPKLHGNSGVKYRVQEEPGQGYAFGPEYQCMNDPDWKANRRGVCRDAKPSACVEGLVYPVISRLRRRALGPAFRE